MSPSFKKKNVQEHYVIFLPIMANKKVRDDCGKYRAKTQIPKRNHIQEP